jgi:hypothetical protein
VESITPTPLGIGTSLARHCQPHDVNVSWRNNTLVTWLLGQGDILGPDLLDTIDEAARRSLT